MKNQYTLCWYAAWSLLVLVATKLDLRNDEVVKEKLANMNLTPITYEDGKSLAQSFGAAFMECSSLTNIGVREIFEQAVRLAFSLEQNKDGSVDIILPPPTMKSANAVAKHES
jgi:GTPase SAR1 family protein